MSSLSPVASLENDFVETRCLQQRFFVVDKQAVEPVCFLLLGFLIIFRPRLTCTWPKISRRFRFRRKATTGFSLKASAFFLLVCKRCQCALMIFRMGGGGGCMWS